MKALDDSKTNLKLKYESETGGQALLSESGRVGTWASSGYVAWLENEVRRLELKILAAQNELS